MSKNRKFLHEYTDRVWRRLWLALLLFNGGFLAALFTGWLLMKQLQLRVWYKTDFFYPFLHFLHDHAVVLAVTVTVAGNVMILLHGLTRRTHELDQVLDAAGRLAMEAETAVRFEPQYKELELQLNDLRQQLLDSRRAAGEAEQRKNDLVMYLAHDLKTPLTSVIGYLSLLEEEPQISEKTREHYVQVALDKAERLEELVDEFFEITRFNLTHITLEKSRISLTRMLQQLIFEFQPMLAERGLSCRLSCADGGAAEMENLVRSADSVATEKERAVQSADGAEQREHGGEPLRQADIMCLCDSDKMQRVFDNLLKNAVNYSYPDTEILIFLTLAGGECCVDFYNHGADIPPDKLERIFEQFFRLDTARRTSGGGAGVGLAIAREIVELHGGTLTAESGGEQVGFHVRFPAGASV